MARLDKWLTFVACIIHQFFVSGTLKANGVIMNNVANFFGTTHTLVAWTFGLQTGVIYMIAPFSKTLLEYFSFRELSVAGGVLTGAGYLYCALVSSTVVEMFASLVISGIGLGISDLPHYLSLEQHFQEDFPKMTTLTSLSHFVGVAAFPPLVQYFAEEYGLQSALCLMGAILWNTIAGGVGLIHRSPKTKVDRVENNRNMQEEKMENGTDELKCEEIQSQENLPSLVENHNAKQLLLAETYLPLFSAMFRHRHFSFLVIIETVAFYIYSSWALFLVSLGLTQGLSGTEAAYLSTVGGVAGVLGRLAAAVLFQFKFMNAFYGSFIPFIVNGITLLLCAVTGDFYILAAFTSLSGFSQGFNQASLLGMLPSQVCTYHFRQAAAISFFLDGIFMQFGGLISGVIVDMTGSTTFVFVFNAMLCVALLPLALLWACDEKQTVEDCNSDTN